MHTPTYYRITENEIIYDFIRNNGFATLISGTGNYPTGTHTPIELEVDEDGSTILVGHISKANKQWKDFVINDKVLVIFISDIHQYISSSWYNHPNVPTWNYMSVHVSGSIKIIEGDELWKYMRNLTNKYEKDSANPINIDLLPDNVKKQINGVVGFKIYIDHIDAQFKLSQNRSDEDYFRIIEQLQNSGNQAGIQLAEIMLKLRNK